jgi:hypothetical protein
MEKTYLPGKAPTLADIVGIEKTRVSSVSVVEFASVNCLSLTFFESEEGVFELSFPLGSVWVYDESEIQ